MYLFGICVSRIMQFLFLAFNMIQKTHKNKNKNTHQQPTNQPTNQPANQPTKKPTNQPTKTKQNKNKTNKQYTFGKVNGPLNFTRLQ